MQQVESVTRKDFGNVFEHIVGDRIKAVQDVTSNVSIEGADDYDDGGDDGGGGVDDGRGDDSRGDDGRGDDGRGDDGRGDDDRGGGDDDDGLVSAHDADVSTHDANTKGLLPSCNGNITNQDSEIVAREGDGTMIRTEKPTRSDQQNVIVEANLMQNSSVSEDLALRREFQNVLDSYGSLPALEALQALLMLPQSERGDNQLSIQSNFIPDINEYRNLLEEHRDCLMPSLNSGSVVESIDTSGNRSKWNNNMLLMDQYMDFVPDIASDVTVLTSDDSYAVFSRAGEGTSALVGSMQDPVSASVLALMNSQDYLEASDMAGHGHVMMDCDGDIDVGNQDSSFVDDDKMRRMSKSPKKRKHENDTGSVKDVKRQHVLIARSRKLDGEMLKSKKTHRKGGKIVVKHKNIPHKIKTEKSPVLKEKSGMSSDKKINSVTKTFTHKDKKISIRILGPSQSSVNMKKDDSGLNEFVGMRKSKKSSYKRSKETKRSQEKLGKISKSFSEVLKENKKNSPKKMKEIEAMSSGKTRKTKKVSSEVLKIKKNYIRKIKICKESFV